MTHARCRNPRQVRTDLRSLWSLEQKDWDCGETWLKVLKTQRIIFWARFFFLEGLNSESFPRLAPFYWTLWDFGERGDWAGENNLLDNSRNKEAPNVAPRDSAAAFQWYILTLGFSLLLTSGVVCVKDAQGSESEREGGDFANLSRGSKSVEAGVFLQDKMYPLPSRFIYV